MTARTKWKNFAAFLVGTLLVVSQTVYAAGPNLQNFQTPATVAPTQIRNVWTPLTSGAAKFQDIAVLVYNNTFVIGLATSNTADPADLQRILDTKKLSGSDVKKYSWFVFVELNTSNVFFTNSKAARRAFISIAAQKPLRANKNLIVANLKNYGANSMVSGLIAKDAGVIDVVHGFASTGRRVDPNGGPDEYWLAVGSFDTGSTIFASTTAGVYHTYDGVSEATRVGALKLGTNFVFSSQ